jgi:hypothetical protein
MEGDPTISTARPCAALPVRAIKQRRTVWTLGAALVAYAPVTFNRRTSSSLFALDSLPICLHGNRRESAVGNEGRRRVLARKAWP